MKNIKNLLFVVAMLLMVGCSKDINVKLSESTRNFEAAGGSAEITLESNGAWQVGNCPDWLNISPMSGEGNATLALTCIANMSSQERSAEIKVSTKTNEAILAVKQAFVEEDFIKFVPDSVSCDLFGGEFPISVEANCDWSVGILPGWIRCEPMSGSHSANLVLSVNSFLSSTEECRECNVIFMAGDNRFPLHVMQTNDVDYHVTVTPNALDFDFQGGTQSVVLQSAMPWSAECSADWVSLVPVSGEGDGEMTVTALPNSNSAPRNARIVITSSVGGVTNLMVRQEAFVNPHYLTVNPTTLTFPHTESNLQLSISSDSLWYISSHISWLSFSSYTGIGESTITLTASEHSLFGIRRGEFQVISGSMNQTVTVIQESAYPELILSFSPKHLQFSSEHGNSSVSISANVSWNLHYNSEWIIPNIKEGLGDTEIQIEVKPNLEQEPRLGAVYLCYREMVYDTLLVKQEAHVYQLEADINELQVDSQGGDFEITISANQFWTLASESDWLHFEPDHGRNDGVVTLTVDANDTSSPRSAIIYLKGLSMGFKTIEVMQSN